MTAASLSGADSAHQRNTAPAAATSPRTATGHQNHARRAGKNGIRCPRADRRMSTPTAASEGASASPQTQPPTENHGPLVQSSRRPDAAHARSLIEGSHDFARSARISAIAPKSSARATADQPKTAFSRAGPGIATPAPRATATSSTVATEFDSAMNAVPASRSSVRKVRKPPVPPLCQVCVPEPSKDGYVIHPHPISAPGAIDAVGSSAAAPGAVPSRLACAQIATSDAVVKVNEPAGRYPSPHQRDA